MEFNDFGQNFLTYKNIKGKTTVQISLATVMDGNMNIDMDRLYSIAKFSIQKGELIDQPALLDIADYFAELILDTGNYAFEDKLKVKVSAFQKLHGYKVTIQPKKSKASLRTYFCLVSKDSKYLVFSHSTDKSDDEIIEIYKVTITEEKVL